MVMYKTAASSLLTLEERWFLPPTERLHPLKLLPSGLDALSTHGLSTSLSLVIPVPVRAFTPAIEEFRFESTSLPNGNSLSLIPPRVTALKEGRQIPHRPSLPRIRTPPSELWNVRDAKSSTINQHTTSLPYGPTPASEASSPQPNEQKSTSIRGPMVVDRRCSPPTPIGTGRPQANESGSRQDAPAPESKSVSPSSHLSPPSPIPDTTLVSLSPGVVAKRRLPTPLSHSFLDVLLENKRRHTHAPTMVSMFNPLREQVSFRAWACIPVRSAGNASTEQLVLCSSRFQTSLPSLEQSVRYRPACDLAASNLRAHKRLYLRKTCHHCPHCKRDTIHKKLLIILYFDHHLRNLFNKPSFHNRPSFPRPNNALKIYTASALENLMKGPAMIMDSELLEDYDSDILDTPALRDLDDFDDFEDTVPNEVDADGDIKMSEADL